MLTPLLLALVLQLPPQPKAVVWAYTDADVTAADVALFLVCLDGQPTSACARVPVTAGVSVPEVPGEKGYTWELPALKTGTHTVAVQACTADAVVCSSGVSVSFALVIVPAQVKGLAIR
jgi:hypothetical protein